jgi:hypothetical protein
MPKDNETAEEYIAANPEKFFIPFEDNFKCLQRTLLLGARQVRPPRNLMAPLTAPSVVNADSVRRKDNRHPQPSRVDAETGENATYSWRWVTSIHFHLLIIYILLSNRAHDESNNDIDDDNAPKKRGRASRVYAPIEAVGSDIFIPASNLKDKFSSKTWRYPYPMNFAYLRVSELCLSPPQFVCIIYILFLDCPC